MRMEIGKNSADDCFIRACGIGASSSSASACDVRAMMNDVRILEREFRLSCSFHSSTLVHNDRALWNASSSIRARSAKPQWIVSVAMEVGKSVPIDFDAISHDLRQFDLFRFGFSIAYFSLAQFNPQMVFNDRRPRLSHFFFLHFKWSTISRQIDTIPHLFIRINCKKSNSNSANVCRPSRCDCDCQNSAFSLTHSAHRRRCAVAVTRFVTFGVHFTSKHFNYDVFVWRVARAFLVIKFSENSCAWVLGADRWFIFIINCCRRSAQIYYCYFDETRRAHEIKNSE